MARKDYSERLRKNYQNLRAAGFSSAEARRFRGASDESINKAISNKQLPPPSPQQQKARIGKVRTKPKYGWKSQTNPPEGIKGRIPYTLVEKGKTLIYNRSYSYVVYYVTVDKDRNCTEKYLVLTSDKPLSKREAINMIYSEIFDENEEKYQGERVIRESIRIVSAFYNPTPGKAY